VLSAFLFGIDVVELARVDAALSRHDGTLAGRLATRDELGRRGATPLPVHCAALLALKEATVKAIGGRPPGFGWHRVEALPGRESPPERIAELFAEFHRAAGVTAPELVRLQLDPSVIDGAATALGLPQRTGRSGTAIGHGCWGVRSGQVFAVTALWASIPDPEREVGLQQGETDR